MLNKYILCSREVLLKFLHILLIYSVPLVRLEQPCHNLKNCWRTFLNSFVSRLQLLVLWTFLGHCLASNRSHTDSNTIKDNLQSTRWGFRNHGTRFTKPALFVKFHSWSQTLHMLHEKQGLCDFKPEKHFRHFDFKDFWWYLPVFSLAPVVHEHLTCGHVGFMFCPVCLFQFYFYVFNQILDFFSPIFFL